MIVVIIMMMVMMTIMMLMVIKLTVKHNMTMVIMTMAVMLIILFMGMITGCPPNHSRHWRQSHQALYHQGDMVLL